MLTFRSVNRIMFVAALGVLLAGWQAGHAAGKDSPAKTYGPINWTDSLTQAQKTAKTEKKVILVDFYAEWCGPCKEMLSTTYKDKAVVARSKKFIPVLINVDKQTKLAEKYKVDAIPVVFFLKPDGTVLRQEVGYHTTAEFLKITDEVLKKR